MKTSKKECYIKKKVKVKFRMSMLVENGTKRKCMLCGNEHLERLNSCDSDFYDCNFYYVNDLTNLYACRYCGLVYVGNIYCKGDETNETD